MAEEPKATPEPMQLEGAEGKGDAEGTAQQQQVDIDALVATLDKIGVRDSQHLESIHQTAQRYGSSAQELGMARQEIDRLSREVERLSQRPQRQADPYGDTYEQQGQPIDLRGEIRSVLSDFYKSEVIEPQQKASEAYWRDRDMAESSEWFPMVQDEYNSRISSTSFQRDLAAGKTSHTNEVHKLVAAKLRDVGQQLKSTAQTLKEQGPQGKQPPHIEAGQTPPARQPEGEDAKRQQLSDIHKQATGTDDDLDAMFKAILPDGDPILRR